VKVDVHKGVDVVVVAVKGRITSATYEDLSAEVDAALADGARKMLIDLAETEFISSAGLRELLTTAKRIRQLDGELRLASLSEGIREVFDISGLTTVLAIFPSCVEALADF